MDDYNKPVARKTASVRERQAQRYRRKHAFVTLKEEGSAKISTVTAPLENSVMTQRLKVMVGDTLWYLLKRTPLVKIIAGVLGLTLLFTIASFVFSDKIAPNVWALDTAISGLTIEQAQAALLAAWQDEVKIMVMLEDKTLQQVPPEQVGLLLDAKQMAEMAFGARLSGIPMGVYIDPIITFDAGAAQRYLLNLTETVYIPPYEAGYAWEGAVLVGIPGRASRELDVALTLQRLSQDPDSVVENRQLTLLTMSTPPNVMDPQPYLAQAEAFVISNFQIIGYDPFSDEIIPWATTQDEMTRWLAAGANGIIVRPNALEPFADAINARLKESGKPRYLDPQEVANAINDAIVTKNDRAVLRIRYLPGQYEIADGDIGYEIGRKTGLPFGMIEAANPGLNWNQLYIGQTINLPSRDALLPQTPVSTKRIIVDLDRLWLVAYENNQMVFNYPISSGRGEAPTFPGIFQILTHTDVAYGSSFTLCDDAGLNCGQWEMEWFMGVYEVVPGLMNGFHGDVLLPNGALLGGGGGARSRSTFGCVMADNTNAKALYDWAELGTVVEIISSQFPPQSALGQQAYEFIRANSF